MRFIKIHQFSFNVRRWFVWISLPEWLKNAIILVGMTPLLVHFPISLSSIFSLTSWNTTLEEEFTRVDCRSMLSQLLLAMKCFLAIIALEVLADGLVH